MQNKTGNYTSRGGKIKKRNPGFQDTSEISPFQMA